MAEFGKIDWTDSMQHLKDKTKEENILDLAKPIHKKPEFDQPLHVFSSAKVSPSFIFKWTLKVH